MFFINWIKLENFRSYSGEHLFEMPTEPGLYYLTGKNNSEPRLGSNGAGKSTLLDAISWCLFGRTLRGLKSRDIVTWGQKNASVAMSVALGDTDYVITRRQSPNSLTIEYTDGKGHPIEQDALNKILRFNQHSFSYSVVLPQFNQAFFDLAPGDKLTLFSQIMELNFWLEKSALADKRAESVKTEMVQAERDILNQSVAISSLESEIVSLQEQEASLYENQQEDLFQMAEKIKGMEAKILVLSAGINKSEELIVNYEKQKDEWNDRILRLEKKRDWYDQQQEQAVADYSAVSSQLITATQTNARLAGLKGVCPSCLQTVSKSHLSKEIKVWGKKVATLETQQSEAEKEFAAIQAFAENVRKSIADAKGVILTYDEDIKTSSRLQHNRTLELGVLKEGIRSLNQQSVKLKQQENVFTAFIKASQKKLSAAKNTLDDKKLLLEELTKTHAAASYWINGFKKLRLFIIEQTLHTLELEVNNSLSSLGLSDWQVTFDVERENKTGGITKGFMVFVKSPAHPEPVRWESWSGGETQRLQLAGAFGLANLIMQQAGLSNKIEFYDEPSNHLSPEGLMDLTETLYQRAMDEQKIVFLIDHHTIEFGDFAQVYQVVKTKTGSSFKSC